MRRFAHLLGGCLLAALPVAADPFGVVDVAAMVPASGLMGPMTQTDGTILYRDDTGAAALCDPTRGRNLADLVIELQMAQTVLMACPGLTNAARQDRVTTLRTLALPRYAHRANVDPEGVRAAFLTRANAEVALVTRCGVTANGIAADVADPWFETRLREAMEAERMPAISCPDGW